MEVHPWNRDAQDIDTKTVPEKNAQNTAETKCKRVTMFMFDNNSVAQRQRTYTIVRRVCGQRRPPYSSH